MILVSVCVALALVLLLAAAALQQWAVQRDRQRFPPPGRCVRVGGVKLHLHETGHGQPVVVLDAGLAASSLSWTYVRPLVAAFTTVVSYDRAGLGWSESPRKGRTLEAMVCELAELLTSAGLRPPYILVGHSFGSLVARAFAHGRAGDVCGLLLVDPVSIRQWASCTEGDRRRLHIGAHLSRRGAWLARFGVVRFALLMAALENRRLAQSIARVSAGKGQAMLSRLVGEVRKLPRELLPVIRAHWSAGKSFRAMAEYLEALPACAAAASQMQIPPEMPLIVLSAATTAPEELNEREQWIAQQVFGRHIQLANTGHWLHLERPDAVAEAIRELVALAGT